MTVRGRPGRAPAGLRTFRTMIGLPLVDNGYLEDVAREAATRNRWEFMISWQITSVPGGTASPFNAIATF